MRDYAFEWSIRRENRIRMRRAVLKILIMAGAIAVLGLAIIME